jgi:glycosyltransferase involved in cell wall biosynthesis
MFTSINYISLSILIALLLNTCILLFYYFFYFLKLGTYKPAASNKQFNEPISVIIAARNEYKTLERNLKSVLEQDYPNFEVIVVNDCSWDESQKLLEYYQEVYSHLKICEIKEQEKYPTGKKFALTLGIKAAQNENLIFTDADCKPASNQWLSLMASKFENNKEIVLGFSPYTAQKGFVNLWSRFESAITGMLYFSAALNKNAFMGVGRNLAYTKSLFFKQKGFAWHQHILSGDDDLFVNKAATSTNVTVQLNPNSFVYTESKRNFNDWSRQKIRHNVTGKYYKSSDKIFLGIFYSANLFFYISIIALLITNIKLWQLIVGIFSFKFLCQSLVYYFSFKKLKYQSLVLYLLVFDVLFVVYMYIFGTIGLFTKQRKMW